MKQILSIFILLSNLSLNAQLHGSQWISGRASFINSQMLIDFTQSPPNAQTYTQGALNYHATSTTYSDYFGNLLFYTNGQKIANKENLIVENGEGLNSGPSADDWAGLGYPALQGAYFMPLPDNDSLLYLFHQSFDVNPVVTYYAQKCYYSIINIKANNGLGKVTEKNVPFLTGAPAEYDIFSAVRHGNGRDWWILTPDHAKNKYYKQLFSPEGIQEPIIQEIGSKPEDTLRSSSNKAFSPDGSKYVDLGIVYGFDVYDFDRCTGELSNARRVDFPERVFNGGGAAFSPNNRFLYITSRRSLIQYDLEYPDLYLGADTIAQIDSFGFCSFYDPPNAPNGFSYMEYGIDGKIYLYNNVVKSTFHVIHEPNNLGSACQIEKCSFELPVDFQSGFPHFPNYRLYDLPDSPCDTLGINGPPDPPVATTEEVEKRSREMVIFPNPTNGAMTIKLPFPSNKGDYLNIYNSIGQIVQQVQLEEFISNKQIDLINQSIWSLYHRIYIK